MNTQGALPEIIVGELRERFPALPWGRERLTHGAFHHVVVLAPDAVIRVRTSRDRRERTRAELEVARALASAGLPVAAPASGPVDGNGWCAAAYTFVSGEPLVPTRWDADRTIILEAVSTMTRAPMPTLPAVRTWCGGVDWPALVSDITRGRTALHEAARAAVDAVLDGERGSALVHGDFGPHNVLVGADGRPRLIDTDHAAVGDPATDLAPLLGWYPIDELRRDFDTEDLRRAVAVKRTLSLQVAAAAELAGDADLREHALGNFARRNP